MNESWQQLQDGQSPLPVVIDNQCLCPFIKRRKINTGGKHMSTYCLIPIDCCFIEADGMIGFLFQRGR